MCWNRIKSKIETWCKDSQHGSGSLFEREVFRGLGVVDLKLLFYQTLIIELIPGKEMVSCCFNMFSSIYQVPQFSLLQISISSFSRGTSVLQSLPRKPSTHSAVLAIRLSIAKAAWLLHPSKWACEARRFTRSSNNEMFSWIFILSPRNMRLRESELVANVMTAFTPPFAKGTHFFPKSDCSVPFSYRTKSSVGTPLSSCSVNHNPPFTFFIFRSISFCT